MVEAERHESENGPVQPDDFASQITTLDGEEATQADQPVTSYTTQENHVPGRGDLSGGRRCDQ
jgi:hypothetical protein